jgi:hypothetical protein
MSREKLTSEQIFSVVMSLAGEIEPYGDTNIDAERLKNLEILSGVVINVVAEICYLIRFNNRSEHSIKQLVKSAIQTMEDVELMVEDFFFDRDHKS